MYNALEDNLIPTEKQYIVVKMDDEQYGIDISYVDNIVRIQGITRVPKAQPYFLGVINLRGEVIPVMSMRIRFGRDAVEMTNSTRIIILKIEEHGLVGILVDEVKEVVTLSEQEVEKPTFRADELEMFIRGVGKYGDKLISLLDVNTLLTEG